MITSESQWLEPPCNEFRDVILPEKCLSRIKEICSEILSRGFETRYQSFFDLLYEQIENEILNEQLEEVGYVE